MVLTNTNTAFSFLLKLVAKHILEQKGLFFIQNEYTHSLIIFSTQFYTTAFAHGGVSTCTASIFPVLNCKQIIDQ